MRILSGLVSTIIGVSCFLCDRFGKKWANSNISGNETIMKGPFRFEKVYNTGWAADSIMNKTNIRGKPALIIRIGIFGAVSAYYIYLLTAKNGFISKIFVSVLLGGAAGNLFELLSMKRVTDFILLPRLKRVVNPADFFIVTGALGTLVSELVGSS